MAGNRDERVPLHPIVIEHLWTVKSFYPEVFPWKMTTRPLYAQ